MPGSEADKAYRLAIRDSVEHECAVESAADLVVTGDRHLLNLKTYEGIAIVRLRDFLGAVPA